MTALTSMGDADQVVILRSLGGPLAKRIGQGPSGWRTQSFSAGAWFSVHQRALGSFLDYSTLLDRVSGDPRSAIVRGRKLPHVDSSRCRRLSNRAAHGGTVTFEPTPRRWLALDIDSVPEPACLTFAAEPEAGVEHVLTLLPEAFAEASCWWQATSSAGVKQGIHCRLWFWLDRSVSDGEAKGWLACYPVDRSLFTPVALHYTAPPILGPGTPPPVARRSGIRRALSDTVEVPPELPATETATASPVAIDAEELTADDLARLSAAVRRSAAARAIWSGERRYPDRSRGHFALAAALARAGCTDPDTLHRVLLAYDQRRGLDTAKILRADYARRTIAAVLARGHRP
jgi:hypothetical protein